MSINSLKKNKNAYRRITSSMPLFVTVMVHIVLIAIAAAIVVQQSGGAKKKIFDATNHVENADKQVEHRLQVARRGGASSASQSLVSANRIFSVSENALQMPAMPDLPSLGAGGFGGFSGMGSGGGMGAGSGMATSLGGGTGLGGRGFMSLSFLGSTTQNVRNVVFVVDTSAEIMEPRKGGFRAFSIIREEIMRLVGRLPPSANFNVVLFQSTGGEKDGLDVNLYQRELVAATTENKKDFFAWMAPVNAKLGKFGPYSALARTAWHRRPIPPEAGLDPLFLPPVWARATQAALEQGPDVVYVITPTQGSVTKLIDEATMTKRKAEADKKVAEFNAEMVREGLDVEKVKAARNRSYEKAAEELAAANAKLMAAGKDPIVVVGNWKIFEPDVQAELKRNGIIIKQDFTGWIKKDGSPINIVDQRISPVKGDTWINFMSYLGRLQKALLPERATLNIYLFVGPGERTEESVVNLTSVAKRNGGNFQLLTTKRLEEIKAKEDAASVKK